MEKETHLEALTEIRNMMERSSRFLSLSGLSGVFAGMYALIGAAAAYIYVGSIRADYSRYIDYFHNRQGLQITKQDYLFFMLDAGSVLLLSILTAWYFSRRRAHKKGLKMWDGVAKRATINLAIPLATGGIFCFVLLYHGLIGLIAPSTLIFYGLALLNAGKYTFDDIRYLGITQIALGLIASFYLGYGLLFWAAGFGLMHIVYGIVMYRKYEA